MDMKNNLDAMGLKPRRVVLFVVALVVLFVWFLSSPRGYSRSKPDFGGTDAVHRFSESSEQRIAKQTTSERAIHMKAFDNKLGFSQVWFSNQCLKMPTKSLRIDNIALIAEKWGKAEESNCRDLYDIFKTIYSLKTRTSEVKIGNEFSKKVLKWFNNNKDLLEETMHQQVTSVQNLYTQESTVFNPLRAKRPGAGGGGGPEVKIAVDKMVNESSADCDFCNYKKMTAQDPFGRVESKYAVSVANTFKIERFHGLILLRHHDPLKFTEEEFLDLMDVAQKWFAKAHIVDISYANPHIYWDVLPKASASQVHPHLHVNLASGQYYAKWARLHAASLQYSKDREGENYFTDLVKVHSALGLTASLGKATVMAYLTPQASHELVFISSSVCEDIFRLLFFAMRAYIDDMGLYAYSAGMVFPKLVAPQSGDLPMIMRLVFRGAVTSTRADISSIELFGTPNVNVDPYKLINSIRKTMFHHGAKPDTLGDAS